MIQCNKCHNYFTEIDVIWTENGNICFDCLRKEVETDECKCSNCGNTTPCQELIPVLDGNTIAICSNCYGTNK